MDKEEKQIREWMREGNYAQVEQCLDTLKGKGKELVILQCLLRIYHAECDSGAEKTVFDYSRDLKVLSEHFIKVKLLMRRLEYDLPGWEELYSYCDSAKVSQYFIAQILLHNLIDGRKVCRKMIEEYTARESIDAPRVRYFQALLSQLEDAAHE